MILNDFSRFAWILLLAHKSEAFNLFSSFCKHFQREYDHSIIKIRSHHVDEFKNKKFELFCDEHDIEHTFSVLRKLQ